MNRKLLLWIIITVELLLLGAIGYVVLLNNEFPWLLLIVTLIVSVVFLYLLRNRLLQPQENDESPLLRSAGWTLLGGAIFLVGSFVYDYIYRQEMRWEMYAGMGLPLLVIGIWWFFSTRANNKTEA